MFGWIMPEPLAMPPTVTTRPPIPACLATVLGRKSVVKIACAASSPPETLRRAINAGNACVDAINRQQATDDAGRTHEYVTHGNGKLLCHGHRHRLRRRQPLCTRAGVGIPAIDDDRSPSMAIEDGADPGVTGAAATRFLVNTPAIGPLTSDTQRAKSRRPGFLIPQWIPAAWNPNGAVMPTCFGLMRVRGGWLGITGRCGEAGVLRNAEHQIHGLNGLPGGSLDEIVDRRDRDDPSGPRIQVHADVAIVCSLDVPRIGTDIFVESNEPFPFIEVSVQVPQIGQWHALRQFTVGGTQDPSIHRYKMGGKCHGHGTGVAHETGEFLFDFRNMTMLSDLIGLYGFMRFRKMIGEGRTSSGSGHPGLCIDYDGIGLHESFGEERRQLEDCGSGIASGRCDQLRLGNRRSMELR